MRKKRTRDRLVKLEGFRQPGLIRTMWLSFITNNEYMLKLDCFGGMCEQSCIHVRDAISQITVVSCGALTAPKSAEEALSGNACAEQPHQRADAATPRISVGALL